MLSLKYNSQTFRIIETDATVYSYKTSMTDMAMQVKVAASHSNRQHILYYSVQNDELHFKVNKQALL